MVVVSVLIVLGMLFFGTVLSLAVSWLSFDTWKTVTLLLLVLIWPVFQYAWTFFYLRLLEIEEPQIHESGPFKASSGMVGPVEPRGGPPAAPDLRRPRSRRPGPSTTATSGDPTRTSPPRTA